MTDEERVAALRSDAFTERRARFLVHRAAGRERARVQATALVLVAMLLVPARAQAQIPTQVWIRPGCSASTCWSADRRSSSKGV